MINDMQTPPLKSRRNRASKKAQSAQKKRTLRLAVCLSVLSFCCYGRQIGVSVSAAENKAAKYQTTARAECVLDAVSRRVLYAYNAQEQLPMASTTKIATALTVLYNARKEGDETGVDGILDKPFLIPPEGTGIEGSSVYLKGGDQTTRRELLYGLMLRSGNDCAVTLALKTSGSVKRFARDMNYVAKQVGALHTVFKNPHGLPEKGHYTTAYDLSMITAAALNDKIFAEIVATRRYEPRGWINKNKLLYDYDGAIGVKTGYTKQAGRCLVSAATRGDSTFVCTLLNCADTYGRTKTLLNDAFSRYRTQTLHTATERVKLTIEGKEVYAATQKDVRYPLLKEEKEYVKKEAIAFQESRRDADGKEILGQLRIYLSNSLIFSENLYKL